LLNVNSDCGNSGASKQVTATGGPNGKQSWLNCGIEDSSGWRPPFVKIEQLVAMDLGQAVKQPNSPFKQCGDFIPLFEKHGAEHNIPPIMLASFAMQESSCNPNAVGGAGEQGLMQITKDKCGGAPGGNCKEPDFNIKTAAKYFADTLAKNDYNVIRTIGEYNGWHPGMNHNDATAAAYTGCCRCQNNLDYLQQFLNGYLQGGTHNNQRLGSYFNLDKC